MSLEVGDRAPDFTLKDQNNQRWALLELHGDTFLVDTDGVIRFVEMNGPGEPRDQTMGKRALAALPF
ncbi:MAG: hypothetical protein M3186_02825 [Actinomycetota bacterium]|nr:hypothetical protein [Actinomycetota bacterium]